MKLLNFFLLLSTFLFAQDNNELMNVINKFVSAKDISANVIIVSNKTMEGNFFYKKNNKYRYEFGNLILVTDGETFWNFDKKKSKVVIDNFDNKAIQFNIGEFFKDIKERAQITKIEEHTFSVKNDKNKYYKDATIWLKNGTIEKINFIDKNNNPYIIKFSNVKLNSSLSDNLFNFEISEGIKVVDLR
ncbi:MAG TPA: outer-membrane lipoprotein carrier protein LolA [Ignavibacteriales bacterium]|jgi:outer membrane lipoprotein-sorting protein|nr:outer-membrane lipoprotein carrier protein LolA [Ignavibacteriales bacterium]